jgi:hypothetical protein
MLEAGLSLSRGLLVMEKQTKNKRLKNTFKKLNESISAGKTFHEAMAEFPKVFNTLFVSMVKAGEEGGKLRADTINDMGKEYETSLRLNDSYTELKNIINQPEFQKMRANIPFFQDKQMKVLSKIGTPYEQELIGNFISASQRILSNAVNSFEGRKFLGEFKNAKDAKVSENDTFNTIVGKMQAGMLLNDYDRKRISIASKLMKDKNIDKQEALEIADKQLDRKRIEDDIKNLIKITIRNSKTGEIKTIPIHEARKMGIPNV